MAGLSLAAWLPVAALCALPGQDPAPHRERLAALLAAPRAQDPHWRGTLFQSASRLEHEPAAAVLPAWEALAAGGTASDFSNLLIYQRRHGLPLAAPAVEEGVDALLERALAAWGAGRPADAREGLERARAASPGDDRVLTNLDWLLRRPPASLSPGCNARAAAHAALAARGALP